MFRLLCLSAYSLLVAANTAPQTTPSKNGAVVQKTEKFKPFTGKVIANKVRIRSKPEVESHIVRQVDKNDLVLIVGEEGDYYAVEPTKDTKAYVFRSYILDNVVEANRVNVRLEPHVDAPIIAQLQVGEKITGQVCQLNHKWLEIAPPKGTHFYVSKEYITEVGGPEYLANMEKRKGQVEELLTAAYLTAENECKKSFEEMSPHQAIDQFQTVLRNFSDFPDAVLQAKEGLALLKETYLNKKIEFLESKAELTSSAKEELIAKHKAENSELFTEAKKLDPELWSKRQTRKENFSFWNTVEESLYLSWTTFHSGKNMNDFYAEQKANATVLTGYVEKYAPDVRNKPGDFILRDVDAPLGYLYSTQVELEPYVGKKVAVLVTPRPNNHFAFPAYYVFGVEQ